MTAVPPTGPYRHVYPEAGGLFSLIAAALALIASIRLVEWATGSAIPTLINDINWLVVLILAVLVALATANLHEVIHWSVGRMLGVTGRINWSELVVQWLPGVRQSRCQSIIITAAPVITITFGLLPVFAWLDHPTLIALLAVAWGANLYGSHQDVLDVFWDWQHPRGTIFESGTDFDLVHEPPGIPESYPRQVARAAWNQEESQS